MANRMSGMAKFARPNTKGVVLRENLFGILNNLRSTPTVWVQSPAGAGKTTLVSSYLENFRIPCLWYQIDESDADLASFFYYLRQAVQSVKPRNKTKSPLPLLTPEYLTSMPLFARRFFEQLFKELSRERVLVFDNYQAVSSSPVFHEAILNGLAAVPRGKQVVIISREAPPAAFSRLKVNGNLGVLTWDQLRLSFDESREIAKLRGYRLSEEQIERIHKGCEGWAAGLVLFLKAGESGGTDRISQRPRGISDDLFNYFAGEVFDHMEPGIQDLLLKTAYLPKVHADHAGRLTGNPHADALLLALSRNQYFVTPYSKEEPVYHYHQLFRQYLMAEAERHIDPPSRRKILDTSARLLLESSNTEEAASLLIQAEDWQSLVQVILSNAQNLLEQGRHETLALWINALPAKQREGSPWISYWLGASELILDPDAGRRHFTMAFELFKQSQDPVGMYLAWSGVIDTFIYAWGDMTSLDRWIEELQCLLTRCPLPEGPIGAKVASAMFCALMCHKPQHPDISLWEERVKQIILHAEDAHLKIMLSSYLMLYYTWWIGGQEKAAFLVEVLQTALKDTKVAPLHYIVWRSIQGASLWMYNHFSESYEALTDGLETAAKTGVHVWDFMLLANMVYWHLCQQKFEEADRYLHTMRFILETRRDMDISHYHFLSAYAKLCRGNLDRAMEHIDAAIQFADKTGWPYPYHFYLSGKADILIEAGDYDQAERLLQTVHDFGQQMRSENLIYQSFWLRALIRHKQNDRTETHRYLRLYLENSKKNSTVNHAWWRSEVMAPLLAEALAAGIEVDHVKRLIREHGMLPPGAVPAPENWPFPVRLYTLGPFSLVVDDEPVTIEVKGKNKPLEMLRALIRPKGQDILDAALSDELWPDAEGDRALRNFTITLHRLRKLIGYPQAVLLKDRRVCLNPNVCWVDSWVLDDLLTEANKALMDRKTTISEIQAIAERLQAVYRGLFLADEEAPWAMGFRRRLHTRWSQVAEQLGKRLEEARTWPAAFQFYRHVLQVEALAEWACQGAMRCGLQLGRVGEAIDAYKRFKTDLQQTHGNSPSPQTEALLLQLRTQVREDTH